MVSKIGMKTRMRIGLSACIWSGWRTNFPSLPFIRVAWSVHLEPCVRVWVCMCEWVCACVLVSVLHAWRAGYMVERNVNVHGKLSCQALWLVLYNTCWSNRAQKTGSGRSMTQTRSSSLTSSIKCSYMYRFQTHITLHTHQYNVQL